MSQKNMQNMQGITATLDDLIRARPNKKITGFAPSGNVTTHQWGNNPSTFRGRGMEFAESRVYQAGDDMRHIDWRITARTGKTHTKLFHEERERPVQILLDMRPMMHFGTRKRFKSHLSAEITAQLAWVAHDGGDRVGAQIISAKGVSDFRATRTRRSLLRFLESVSDNTQPNIQPAKQHKNQRQEKLGKGNQGVAVPHLSLAEGIGRLRRVTRPGALVFIVSDFNDLDDKSTQELNRLSVHAHVTIIQVLDQLDRALPSAAGRLTDGRQVISLSGASRRELNGYAEEFSTRQALLAKTCAKNGIAYHILNTTDEAKALLFSANKHRK